MNTLVTILQRNLRVRYELPLPELVQALVFPWQDLLMTLTSPFLAASFPRCLTVVRSTVEH